MKEHLDFDKLRVIWTASMNFLDDFKIIEKAYLTVTWTDFYELIVERPEIRADISQIRSTLNEVSNLTIFIVGPLPQ